MWVWLEKKTEWNLLSLYSSSLFLTCIRCKYTAGSYQQWAFQRIQVNLHGIMSHCPAFTGLSDCLWCQRRADKQPSPAWWKTPPRNFAWWEKSHVFVMLVTITLTLRKQTLTDQTHFKRGFLVVLLRLFVYCGSSFCVSTFVFTFTSTRAATSGFIIRINTNSSVKILTW